MAEVRKRRHLRHRPGVDDRPRPALDHRGHEFRYERERAPQVGLEDLARLGQLAGHPSKPLNARPRVVDEHVDTAKLDLSASGDFRGCSRTGEIRGKYDRRRCPAGAELACQLAQAFLAAGDQRQPRATLGEHPGRFPSDAARCARQKNSSSRQRLCHSSSV
jgi:hypothetical protein